MDAALAGALHIEYLRKRDLGRRKPSPRHTLLQTSTIDALLDGNYDGDVSFADLARGGDFGLGTLDALDGEMVALDGGFYQVRADGSVCEIEGDARTPFAVVTFFEPDLTLPLRSPLGLGDLCSRVDELAGDETPCCAVRVDGHFDYVKTRSVPRQHRPYPPLVEVVERQPTFELRDVPGSVVGFRFPDYARALNVAGYHFHFITADRNAGGHVLALRLAGAELSVDREAELRLELPPGVRLPAADADRAATVDRVERG